MTDGPVIQIITDWPEVVIQAGDDTPDLSVSAPPQPQIILSEMGMRGPSGAGAVVYEHAQAVASNTWIVNHNLGRRPLSVQLLTSGGVEFGADIVHISDNQLVVSMESPFTGFVRVM